MDLTRADLKVQIVQDRSAPENQAQVGYLQHASTSLARSGELSLRRRDLLLGGFHSR